MVDLRKGITALALLVLFVGLASAQVGGTGQVQLTCNTNVTVTPQLRSEGWTEQTGDITITCTGGNAITTVGSTIPLVNFKIFYSTNVTSRLLNSVYANANEALLLVDEPGAAIPGDGPARAQKLCATPLTGCAAVVNYDSRGVIFAATDTLGTGPSTAAASNYSPNVYQGVADSAGGNAVTFFGVPVLPPTTTGSRVYRITNVRVNAQAQGGGSTSGAAAVVASIAISGATSLGIQNSSLVVGYVSPSLTATAATAKSLQQCVSKAYTATNISTLTFTENFGTAFKTRVAAQNTAAYSGQNYPFLNGEHQNIPGAIYNSESNFIFQTAGGTTPAGLADYGTRLKATFNNVPSGVTIWVSQNNVTNAVTPLAPPSPVGGSGGNTGTTGWAQLVNGETTGYGSLGITNSSSVFLTPASTSDVTSGGITLVQVPISGGTGSAVWEVLNTNPNTNESFKFAVYSGVSPNLPQNIPTAPNTSTVNLSYAPVYTSGAATTGVLPRFTGDSTPAGRTLVTTIICRTILLYPYIVNQIGLDTGIAIANTSQDPFTAGSNATQAQAGTCTLSFYPADPTVAIPPNFTTGTVKGGNSYADLLSAHAPGFQGYMFAVCNFQYAHGFAYISDIGVRNLSMGYLALIIPDPGVGSRLAQPFGGDPAASAGEQDAH
jgi:hypothetical protein